MQKIPRFFQHGLLFGSICLQAHGASGTWTNAANDGLWSDPANWSEGIVAEGATFNAGFGSIDLTADNTVHLDAPHTLTSLTFGDSDTATPGGWILDNHASATNILTLAGTSPTITVNALGTAKTATISAVVAGTDGLIKVGSGTLLLSAANTYSGGTTLSAGTLATGNNSGLGTGTLTLDGGTFQKSGAGNITFANAITVGAAGGTLDVTALTTAQTTTLSGLLSGSGALTLRSQGDLSNSGGSAGGLGINFTHAGNSGYSGPITVTSGLMSRVAASSFGTGVITLNGGGIVDPNLNFAIANNITLGASGGILRVYGNGTSTYSGVLSGGALKKTDTGVVMLTGVNTYTGSTTIGAGTLLIGTTGQLGAGSYAGAVVNGGTLRYSSTLSQTLSGVISGAGALTKDGASGTLTLTGANTYTGLTTVSGANASTLLLASTTGPAIAGNVFIGKPFAGGSGGTLLLGADNQLSASSVVTFDHAFGAQDALFKLNGFSTSIAGLQNGGTDLGGKVQNGSATTASTLTLAGAGNYTFGPSSGYHGIISDGAAATLSILKTGSGTQTFTGANTYTGTTQVSGGTLNINGSLAATATTVQNGGTLGGTGTITGTVALQSGATLAPGVTLGTLGTGELTLASGATLASQINSSGVPAADKVNVTGNVTLGGTLAITDLAEVPAEITLGTKLTLISYSGTLTGTFTGLPEGSRLAVGGNRFKIAYADSQSVTLEAIPLSDSYTAWAADRGLDSTNNDAAQDPDDDGVSNLLEFYLGGDPLVSSNSVLPVVGTEGAYMTFTFLRTDAAESAMGSQILEFGSDLSEWKEVALGAGNSGPDANGVIVSIDEDLENPDIVTVKIPMAPGSESKLFARLKVTR